MTGYDAYVMFLSLRNHFRLDRFDYFKYKGLTSTNPTKFNERQDKWIFEKLAKKYTTKQELEDFFVANLLSNHDWIFDLFDDSADERYLNYRKRKESLTYLFEEDMKKVFASGKKLMYTAGMEVYPHILRTFLQKEISLESFIMLNRYVGFFEKIDNKVGQTDVVWSHIRKTATKFEPFLKFDYDKVKKVLKKVTSETS
jgi:hypothetical protein